MLLICESIREAINRELGRRRCAEIAKVLGWSTSKVWRVARGQAFVFDKEAEDGLTKLGYSVALVCRAEKEGREA